jgi:hypothetical protein
MLFRLFGRSFDPEFFLLRIEISEAQGEGLADATMPGLMMGNR